MPCCIGARQDWVRIVAVQERGHEKQPYASASDDHGDDRAPLQRLLHVEYAHHERPQRRYIEEEQRRD